MVYHMVVAREQVIVQFTPELLALLDEHVASAGKSRSEVIRHAVEAYLKAQAEAEADRRLVEAYTRMPQEDGPEWDDDLRDSILEEPW
jgi:metal-responsive CopG/Arc/MetJ family transcriptional regulator